MPAERKGKGYFHSPDREAILARLRCAILILSACGLESVSFLSLYSDRIVAFLHTSEKKITSAFLAKELNLNVQMFWSQYCYVRTYKTLAKYM